MTQNRRSTRSFFSKLRDFVWPQIGWKRLSLYYWHRLTRLSATPESIAAGFACGAAASMTPLMGFHFALAALLALTLRGNLIASAVGTVVGNPWTFPFIWMTSYEIGQFILGAPATVREANVMLEMFKGLAIAIWNFDGGQFLSKVWPIWFPMFVGGIPMAMIAGLVFYILLVGPIRRVHERRRLRLAAADKAARA